jgi:acyl-CoA synthetase (AMP-forming)/AMP-acid ligase II
VKNAVAAGERPFEYRTLAHLPVAHIAGLQGYLINLFYAGGLVYWMPKFDFQLFLEYHKKYKITVLFSVPAIYLLIAKSPLVTDQLNALKLGQSGAAPLDVEVQRAASAKFGRGQTFLGQTWGQRNLYALGSKGRDWECGPIAAKSEYKVRSYG